MSQYPKIAVVGAGLMGHGIAQVFAERGHEVRIYDPNPSILNTALERVSANLVALGRNQQAVVNITPCGSLADAATHADFVFEAGPERLEVKQAIFAELEQVVSPAAILATNTSVMPIGEIGSRLQTKQRMIGTHWWNPPYLVPLVEVVPTPDTAVVTVESIMELLSAAGKEPVHVKRDVPGFVGNRLQHALWREAIALVASGVCDGETVDRVVKSSFGPRLAVMGPIENADYVGLDLTLDIHEHVLGDLDHTPAPSPYLRELVADGKLGMKTGQGLRDWEPGAQHDARARLLDHLSNTGASRS